MECFEMTAESFDLAEQLQTPILILTDLDLGMNDHMSEPFRWDNSRRYKRGKVLTAEQLEDIGRFGRYLDVDGDGIPYRTYPGTHPTKGAFFTRGTSRDEYAVYTEDGAAYQRNMDRLLVKWNTAKTLVPPPELYQPINLSPIGILFFGTSTYSAVEAMDLVREEGVQLDALRLKAFPFTKEVEEFVHSHQTVFVIEQNRDAQLRSLLLLELGVNPVKLVPVLNYDGTPITAHTISTQITDYLSQPRYYHNDLPATAI
jgi:2-oxoglutarate ferredoxin oxidoreductase subunit alpha